MRIGFAAEVVLIWNLGLLFLDLMSYDNNGTDIEE